MCSIIMIILRYLYVACAASYVECGITYSIPNQKAASPLLPASLGHPCFPDIIDGPRARRGREDGGAFR